MPCADDVLSRQKAQPSSCAVPPLYAISSGGIVASLHIGRVIHVKLIDFGTTRSENNLPIAIQLK